ncbi:hypothetical protein ACFXDJ_16130 [Streptomyces sp. NPDC059443]|uniref:hypothetical protein n=1 Tax=unclassified Streptomyces TaxID=2593676 RepID=UPI003689F85B
MRGDETQRGVSPDAESRERRGPRHAAPRKSLLTKFQIPVGKTMALAAMPTAVFVGMSMAPKLAVADDQEIPFAPGPCVTRSDEPAESASPSPSSSPSKTPPTTPPKTTEPEPGKSPTAVPSPTASPSASKPVEKPAEKPVAPAQKQAVPAPAAKASNPLDPLGVGDALKGLVDELGKPLKGAPAPSSTPTPAVPKAATPKPADKPAPAADPSADAIRAAADKAGVTVTDLSQEVKDTATTPKDETGATGDAAKAKTDTKAADTKATDTKAADGKEPFPCPTYDAKALADAEVEQGIPLLPDEPWYLNSSLLTLYGLDYAGIVEVKTAGGKTKKVLKFTADSLDIKDLYQTVGTGQTVAHLKSRPGSTSKIRGAKVTMYTESLKGNLFGLIPIEFTPNSPPPLNVPFAFFTNVKVVQAGQFGGTLTVPGLKNYIGPAE